MENRTMVSRLRQVFLASPRRKTEGFTLIELLVVTVIAGGIVSGLLYIVVQLLGVDQRESARTETQREMQMALDYMSTELREAVYVYDANSLTGTGVGVRSTTGATDGLDLSTVLPAALFNNSTPVLVFWKQDRFSAGGVTACATATPTQATDLAKAGVNCTAGSAYSLVAYSLSTNNPSSIWSGQARITRYAYTQFRQDGTVSKSYVNPASTGFRAWPVGTNKSNTLANLIPDTGGRIDDGVQPAALVDFVATTNPTNPNPTCPGEFTATSAYVPMTPPATAGWLNKNTSLVGVRSFYACVREGTEDTNSEVGLYLQGNTFGRPGVFTSNFLPTLQTRVLGRGVLSRPSVN
jgi:prepilin-type N-terminal cleavage/methylation domain-containing protein